MKNLKILVLSVFMPFIFAVPHKASGMESISAGDEMPRIRCLWNLGPKVYQAAALEILEKKICQEPFQGNHKLRITYLKKLGEFLKEPSQYPLGLEILRSDGGNHCKIVNFYNLTIEHIKSASLSPQEKMFQTLKVNTFYNQIPGEITKLDHEERFKEIMRLYRVLERNPLTSALEWKLRYFYNCHIQSSTNVESLMEIAQQASKAATVTHQEEARYLNRLAAKITFKLGKNVPSDLPEEKKLSRQSSYYDQSSQLGYALATYYLAELLNDEKNGDERYNLYDFEKAYEHYLSSARRDSPFSLYKMAKILENGDERLYIDPDKEGAQEWHKKAAGQGHPYSQYELAIDFMGSQRKEEEEEGITYLQKSAESGYVKAQLCLAHKHKEGYRGIPKDSELARFWYHKAAEQEEGQEAYYPLGDAYEARADYERAIFFYEKSKDARACVRLGKMYLKGKGMEKSDLLAVECFDKATEQGSANGNYYLGLMKLKGQGYGKPELGEAFDNFTAAAQYGHPKAFLQLGIMKQFGLGTTQSHDEAKKFYEKAGQHNIADALYYLGILYNLGYRVEKALAVWEQAAKLGHRESCYKAGKSYLKVWLSRKDEETAAKAQEYLKKAGKHIDALYLLGLMQESGISYEKNPLKAIKYYEQAASKGHASAQFKLGKFHEAGDKVKAFNYYRQAADQGHIEAFLALGMLYQLGEGTFKDLSEAFSCFKSFDQEISRSVLSSMKSLATEEHREAIAWLQDKASEGNPNAQRYLGKILEMGVFLPQDIPQAISLYQQASQKGRRSAQRRLADFKKALVFEAIKMK